MVASSMGLIFDKADCQPELIDLLKLKETEVSNAGVLVFYLLNPFKDWPARA